MNSSWCSTQHGENSQSLTMWVITIARAEKVWAKIQNKFESPLRNIDAGEQRKYSSYPFRVSIFLSGFWVLPVNATLSSIIFTLVFTVFFPSFFSRFLSCIRRNLLPFVRGVRTPFYLVYFGNRKGICSFLLRPRNILIFRILISVRCC